MKESDRIFDVEHAGLFAEHFGVPANRYIFMSMAYLKSKKVEPSPMAIMEVVPSGKAKEEVEKIGGLDYLLTLQEAYVQDDSLNIFIDKTKQAYTRRMLYNTGRELMAFVSSNKAEVLNPSELVHYAETKLVDIGTNTSNEEEVYKMGDDTEEILKERSENPMQIAGLEVGMEEYDRLTNGSAPGDLTVVVAPSKTGKSVLLTNWAKKISIIDKLPVLYIDTEMSSREQEDRLLANITGIPEHEIRTGMYVMDTVNGKADVKSKLLREAKDELKEGNYYHVYMPQFTIESVTALARKFKMQFGIVALFFDYIKIPSSDSDFKSAQEYQKLGFFTSGLKDIAGTLKIPVYTAAQANRSDTKTEKPSESDIGGSYRILQLASKLVFLYNKSEERIARDGFQNGNQMLFIKFQRNGESDCEPISLMFDKAVLRMREI